MTRAHALVLAGSACAVAALATPAAAKPVQPPDDYIVIAGDPPPPPPQPESLPPPPKPVPRESTIALASGAQAWTTDEGGLIELGQGGSLSVAFLQRDGDFPTGFELGGWFLRGDDASVYDLSFRLVGSAKLGRRSIVPFVAIGLAAGASRIVDARAKAAGEDVSYGVAIGPSGAVGVHGFLGDSLYWRAGAGVLGAGVGAVTADIGLGLVID